MALLKIELKTEETDDLFSVGLSHDQFHLIMEQIYLDWVNNYLSIECFARAYGISEEHASALIQIGKLGSTHK